MDPQRFRELEEAFHQLLELPESARSKYLDERFRDDPQARADVEKLLHHHDQGTPGEWQQSPSVRPRETRLVPGQVLGEFRIQDVLGEGGFGVVYRAEQASLKREVALKVLPPEAANNLRALDRFRREAEAGARLRHPNIVAVHEFRECEGYFLLAQELVTGGRTLVDRLWEWRNRTEFGRDHYRELAEFFIQVAEALQAAHEHQIVHRDIKPSNILLDPNGRPKIADFGIARVLSDVTLSQTGEFMGTPFYMSPEQVSRQSKVVDERADQFSLGATLYECLTLNRAFQGDGVGQVFQRILQTDPPEPNTVRDDIPWELSAICMKALEKSPQRRYASMETFAADLRSFLRHESIVARLPGPGTRAIKWTRRHPLLSSIVAISITALVLILFAWKDSVEQRDLAEWQSFVANTRGAFALHEQGSPLEARRMLEAVPEKLRGWEWDHCRLLQDNSIHRLEFEGVRTAFLSSNGERTAAVAQDGSMKLWDTRTGIELRSWQAEEALNARVVDWSLDSGVAVSKVADTGWILWEPESGRILHRLAEAMGEKFSASLSPDGSWLATSEWDGPIRLWSVATGKVVRELLPTHRQQRLDFDPESAHVVARTGSKTMTRWNLSTDSYSEFSIANLARPNVFALNSSWLAYVGPTRANNVRLHEIDSPRWTKELLQPNPVVELELAADAHTVALALGDHRVLVQDVSTEAILGDCVGCTGPIRSLALSADGRIVVAASNQRFVRVWDLNYGGPQFLHDMNGAGFEVSFHPNEAELAIGRSNGQVCILDLPSGDMARILDAGTGAVGALAYSSDGAWLATGDNGGRIHVWNTETWERTRLFANPVNRPDGQGRLLVWALTFDPEGRWLAGGAKDGTIRIWELGTWREWHRLEGHQDEIASVAFHPHQPWLASGDASGEVRLWNVAQGELLRTIQPPTSRMGGVAGINFNSAGDWLAAGFARGFASVWNVATGEPIASWEDQTEAIEHTDFEPNTKRMVLAGGNGSIRIWDLTRPDQSQTLAVLHGHTHAAYSAVFSPDGKRLVSVGPRQQIRFWESDFESARELWRGRARRQRLRPAVEDLYRESGDWSAVMQQLTQRADWNAAERNSASSVARELQVARN